MPYLSNIRFERPCVAEVSTRKFVRENGALHSNDSSASTMTSSCGFSSAGKRTMRSRVAGTIAGFRAAPAPDPAVVNEDMESVLFAPTGLRPNCFAQYLRNSTEPFAQARFDFRQAYINTIDIAQQ